ncbi:MAG: AgmX/PglI C-terminal domain-containing protein [Myxococcota bacterium]
MAELARVTGGSLPAAESRTRLVWSNGVLAVGAPGEVLETVTPDEERLYASALLERAERAPFLLEVRADTPTGELERVLIGLLDTGLPYAFRARRDDQAVRVDVRPKDAPLESRGASPRSGRRVAWAEELGDVHDMGLVVWLRPRALVFGHASELPSPCHLTNRERRLPVGPSGRRAFERCLEGIAKTGLPTSHLPTRPSATVYVEPDMRVADLVRLLAQLRTVGAFTGPFVVLHGDERPFAYGTRRDGPRQKPELRVWSTIPEVEGGLSRGRARRVSYGHRLGLQSCFEELALTRPGDSGELALTITIGAGGSVAGVRVRTVRGPANEPLGACVADDVRRWRYPRPVGGPAETRQRIHYEHTAVDGGAR